MSWLNPFKWFSKKESKAVVESDVQIKPKLEKLDHVKALQNALDLIEVYFGRNTDMLLTVLQNTGAIISGSFVLQCYLNELWTNSDVDIFCPVQSKYELENTTIHIIFTQLFQAQFKVLSQPNGYYKGMSNRVFSVYDYTLPNGQKIQVIYYKPRYAESPFRYICDQFDFDFCKGAMGISSNGQSWIKNYSDESIINRTTVYSVTSTHSAEGTLKRKDKYVARGFTFTGTKFNEQIRVLENKVLDKKVQEELTNFTQL